MVKLLRRHRGIVTLDKIGSFLFSISILSFLVLVFDYLSICCNLVLFCCFISFFSDQTKKMRTKSKRCRKENSAADGLMESSAGTAEDVRVERSTKRSSRYCELRD